VEAAPAPVPEAVAEAAPVPIPEPVAEASPEPVAEVAPEAAAAFVQDMPVAPVAAPELAETPQAHAEASPVADDWMAAITTAQVEEAVVAEVAAPPETTGEAQAFAALEQLLDPQVEAVVTIESLATEFVAVPAPEPPVEAMPPTPAAEALVTEPAIVAPPVAEQPAVEVPVVEAPVAEKPVVEQPLDQPVPAPVVEEAVAPEPAAAAPVEEQPAIVEEPTIAAIEEPVLEVIEEEEEVVAVAETVAASTFAEATVDGPTFVEAAVDKPVFAEVAADKPAFAEAAVHQPAIESQPAIEPPRIEAPQGELPRVDAPPPPAAGSGAALPLTRTVRIEVPPRTVPARAASAAERLLRLTATRGATALFLTAESRPWMRLEGELRYLDSEAPLSHSDVESAILEIAPESSQESMARGEGAEWITEFEHVGRVRCTTFTDHRGKGVLLRVIATKTATAEQLGLPAEVQALATESQGLVLVAGQRASGKSTLLSALVDLVNRRRAEYVITLERQVRLVQDNKLALVSQREIHGGADESVAALRAALRESPDVLVVDDLLSPAMVPLLLTAASDGLLIFASITASSTSDAVARFVELAPPEMRKAAQTATAESFRGAVGQVLLKKAAGGVLPAREVLLESGPVTRVISEGQFSQLTATLESGRKHGMVSFNDLLVEFVRAGTVDVREAFRKAHDRERLLESLKASGIATKVVERLA
jgi:twitching motility protein PilT